jgi:GDP-mannose 6-dehydrogenase
MRLEIWGLGHVGLVCAAGLARRGHRVVGVDVDAEKVARLNAGETCFREPGLADRVAAAVASGHLVGTTPEGVEALPDASLLCLPTPAASGGKLDTQCILAAAVPLALRLRAIAHFHTVIVCSTVPVHFTEHELRPLLEIGSGGKGGAQFGLAMVPQFFREGHALADFDDPPLIVLGADDPASRAAIQSVFRHPRCPSQDVSTGTAEFFKLTNNAFHALKVGFANELARVAHAQNIDGHRVLRLLCQDRQLNLSSTYLEPGFAFGGACLEKDLGALGLLAAPSEAPILAAISASNRTHLDACLRAIRARHCRRLGFYGVTNKAGSDDLRHSPVLALVEALQPPPGTLWVCDPDLRHDHAPFLLEQYGAQVVADLHCLQKQVDLVVNFRSRPLPDSPNCSQLHFASFWQGNASCIDVPPANTGIE